MVRLGVVNKLQFGRQALYKDGAQLGVMTTDLYESRGRHEIGPTIGIAVEYRRIGLDLRFSNTVNTKLKGAKTQMLAISATYLIF